MKKFLIGFAVAGLILIVFSMCVRTFAQTLVRKGWFGVAAQPLDETQAKNNNLKTGEGLLVTVITPKGTFESIGVKVGDVILSVNQKAINSPAELIASAQSLNENDAVEVNFVSGGAKLTKKGTVKGRLKENSDTAEVLYDVAEMSLGKLRTIIYKPKNKSGKLPAVFYIQGLPCQSHELGQDSKDPRKMIFEDWVKAGFAVFRVERPNIGDSITTKDCRDIDFSEEIEVNKAGYKKLLAYDFIDTENIRPLAKLK